MITGFEHLHSLLRWVILLLLIITIIKHFNGKKSGLTYAGSDKKLALFTLIVAHIQLLLGLVLYISRGRYQFREDTMSEPIARFWAVEHIAGMVIAIILITIGYSKAKKMADHAKRYGTIFKFYLIALILIILSIPWPFRKGLEYVGWF